MDETIVAPIGLVMGIITSYAVRIRAEPEFGFNQKSSSRKGVHKNIHSSVRERSPPLSDC